MTISKLTKALFTTGLDLGNTLQLIFAVLLLILGVLVAIQGVKKLFEKNDEKPVSYTHLCPCVLREWEKPKPLQEESCPES